MLRRLLPDSFVLVLLATLALATLLPARGIYAAATSWIATTAIALLFFFHGAKLSRAVIAGGARHWRLHGAVLACTYGMFPLLCLSLAVLFPDLLPESLWTGFLFLAALSSTVQSSIAFTSMANGNVPAAITSASLSQLLGVFITPLLVGILVIGTVAEVRDAPMPLASIGKVVLLILAPFVAGQFMRPLIGSWVTEHKAVIAVTDRSTILLAVYSAFSAAVVDGIWQRVPVATLGLVALLCAGLLLVVMIATTLLARWLGFARQDEAVLVFCGSKKSLVQGVPMARILFPGPDLGLILLPIMIFHQLQLMVCAWVARGYARSSKNV